MVGLQELPQKFRYIDESSEDSIVVGPIPNVTQLNDRLAGIDSPVLLPVNGLDLRDYLQNLESSLIQQALDDTNGVVAHAAEKLNVRRTTLVEKMRKYNLGRKESSAEA